MVRSSSSLARTSVRKLSRKLSSSGPNRSREMYLFLSLNQKNVRERMNLITYLHQHNLVAQCSANHPRCILYKSSISPVRTKASSKRTSPRAARMQVGPREVISPVRLEWAARAPTWPRLLLAGVPWALQRQPSRQLRTHTSVHACLQHLLLLEMADFYCSMTIHLEV